MPRKTTSDEKMPRRRRAARAAAMDDEEERGLVLRILLHSPKDTLAAFVAFAACSVIVANALFLQKGRHAAPMFGRTIVPRAAFMVPRPLPRPRPAQADAARPEPLPDPRPFEQRPADPLAGLVKATAGALPPAHVLRPPVPISEHQSSERRRVAAVQRVLSEYGYGQLRPTGTIDPDTRAAIRRFEEERKLPATGQISARLVRELSAMIGRPIE